ncbi:MAG: DUF1080 domain-containing protein [Tannerellaceae bacterium]|nr:DUF1080 domain-containing protein [Tannerellaceae bacterium]
MKITNCAVKAAGCAIALTICTSMNAQKEYPKPTPMTPEMSEYWTPQPRVVTPGDMATQSAPSDAVVLFNGKDLSAWESVNGGDAKWNVENGAFVVTRGTGDIQTKEKFESFQLHLEWSAPEEIKGESQGRGNSGVFLQGMYEIQILDCYDNETYVNGQTGSVYKQTPPLVNAMRKPGEWNTYDIIYTAPVFKEDGTYLYPPRVTVIQNGIVLQNNTTILGTTEYIGFPKVIPHGAGPIKLQDHGDAVKFRNIWLRKL